jgi:hypothetical protein
MNESTRPPTFSEADERTRKAILKTVADGSIQNPRATELRKDVARTVSEQLIELDNHDLAELAKDIGSSRVSPFWA